MGRLYLTLSVGKTADRARPILALGDQSLIRDMLRLAAETLRQTADGSGADAVAAAQEGPGTSGTLALGRPLPQEVRDAVGA